MSGGDLGYTTPEKRKVEGRADTLRSLPRVGISQLSHGLTGRCRTTASMPDTRQDADLRIRIPAHCPDALH